MICPFCGHLLAELWQPVEITTDEDGKPNTRRESDLISVGLNRPFGYRVVVQLRWMRCHNFECGQILVRVNRRFFRAEHRQVLPPKEGDPENTDETWFAVPKKAAPRVVESLVPPDLVQDYTEAALILEDSPRASAVLSRRVLAELLERYANEGDYKLSVRIDNFVANLKHPTHVREPMHVLRVMGDFVAHVKRDKIDQAVIINVSHEEAAWTLTVLDRLFDYFIVTPGRDAAMRASINEKRVATGQQPIPDLEDKV